MRACVGEREEIMRLLEEKTGYSDIEWVVDNYGLDDMTRVHREIHDKVEGGIADDEFHRFNVKEGEDALALVEKSGGVYNMFRTMALDYDMYFSMFDLDSVDSNTAEVLSDDVDMNSVESHVQLYDKIDTQEVRDAVAESFPEIYAGIHDDDEVRKEDFMLSLDGLCEDGIQSLVDGIVGDILYGKPWVGKVDKDKSDMSVSMYYYVMLSGQKDDEPDTLTIRVSDHGNKHGEETVEMSLFDDYGDPLNEADFQNTLTDMISDWLSQNTSLEF